MLIFTAPIIISLFQTSKNELILNAVSYKAETFTIDLPVISTDNGPFRLASQHTCNSCNMGMRDLPDMYTRSPRAAGPRAEGIHIRQITSAHVTTNM